MTRILVALAALTLAGTAAAAEGAAAVYAAKCNACHGPDGKGSAVGKRMGASDLTAVKGSEGEIAAAISNGKGKMPAFKGKISPEEIRSLARYVKGGLR